MRLASKGLVDGQASSSSLRREQNALAAFALSLRSVATVRLT